MTSRAPLLLGKKLQQSPNVFNSTSFAGIVRDAGAAADLDVTESKADGTAR